MIRFSFSSFYMSLLFANVMILVLYISFRNQKLLIKLGLPILSAALCMTILRMLFPFEFLYISHNVILPNKISMIIAGFQHPRFFHEHFSFWSLLKIIWLAGSILSVILCIKNEYNIYQIVNKYSKKLPESAPAVQILRQIQQEFPQTDRIDVREFAPLQVPMIYGLRKPHILLPVQPVLDHTQLFYILRHEITHYLHHDMLIKYGVQFLYIIYWWNPFCKLLQEQVEAILEMRVDQTIVKHPVQKIEYLDCLISIAEYVKYQDIKIDTVNSISFCQKSFSLLKQRFNILMEDDIAPLQKRKKHLLLFMIVVLYILSFSFIFEASFIPVNDSVNSYEPQTNNSYLIEGPDGTYDYFLDNKYVETIDSLEFYPNNIPIYERR